MSRRSFIEIKFFTPVEPLKLIDLLCQNGWRLPGWFTYLPLHDDGMYEWQLATSQDKEKVWDIFREQEKLGERIALSLEWESSGILCGIQIAGDIVLGDCAFFPNKSLPTLPIRYTDVSWYLQRLLPSILEYNDNIDHIEWRWH